MPHALINRLGSLAGFAGMIVCLVALMVRLTGQYYLAGLPLATLFLGGIGLVVSGCFLKLHFLARG
jgi:hypothetical protein